MDSGSDSGWAGRLADWSPVDISVDWSLVDTLAAELPLLHSHRLHRGSAAG